MVHRHIVERSGNDGLGKRVQQASLAAQAEGWPKIHRAQFRLCIAIEDAVKRALVVVQ